MLEHIRQTFQRFESPAEPVHEGRQAAVAAVFAPDPLRVLLIRRAEVAHDPWSGQMAFPGGRREERDQDLWHTAVRETSEEVGLDLRGAESLGAMEDVQAVARGLRLDLRIRPYFFAIDRVPELTPNREVASVHWAEVAPMLRGERDTVQPWNYEGKLREFPAYDVDGRAVWGLTYKMLRQLFASLQPASRP